MEAEIVVDAGVAGWLFATPEGGSISSRSKSMGVCLRRCFGMKSAPSSTITSTTGSFLRNKGP